MVSMTLHGTVAMAMVFAPTVTPPRPMTIGPPMITVLLTDGPPTALPRDSADRDDGASAPEPSAQAPETPAATPDPTPDPPPRPEPEPEPEPDPIPDPEPAPVTETTPEPDPAVPPPDVKPTPPERPARPAPVRPTRPASPRPVQAILASADQATGQAGRHASTPVQASATGGGGAGGSAGAGDQAPLYVLGSRHTPAPRYPEDARRRGHEGTVVLSVRVAADGTVIDLRVFRSSGHGTLDRAARGTVRGWRFHPATRAGVPVRGQARVAIRFALR